MSNTPQHADVLILGQGLAGSTLAWRLAELGLSVSVVDRGGVDEAGRPSSSHVAAGLITPITGRRLTLADDFATQWQEARKFYERIENQTGQSFLLQRPAVRLFIDDSERERFLQRCSDASFAAHARRATEAELPAAIPAPLGGFVMPTAARLNVSRYLRATRSWLDSTECYFQVTLDPEVDIDLTSTTAISVPKLGLTTRRVVLCQGHVSKQPNWLADAKFAPAKGEVLTIESPALRDDRVLHRGVWIAPDESGQRGRYRAGSTYEWDRLDSLPTDEARQQLLTRLADARLTGVRVIDHQAAVRPATSDRQPVCGFSSGDPRIGWLNGLGAKGSLWAPWYAGRLARRIAASFAAE